MILSFNIEYRTNWGEEVRISGSFPELGNKDLTQAIPLHTIDGTHWTIDREVQQSQEALSYSYSIWKNGQMTRKEWNMIPRCLYLQNNSSKKLHIYDSWKNIPEQLYFYASAFTESLLAHHDKDQVPQNYQKGIIIKAYAPTINENFCLAICGNQKIAGDWNPDKAILMNNINFPEWQVSLDVTKLKFPLEYKFILYNKKEKKAEAWENNPNRYMAAPNLKSNETMVISDRYASFNVAPWKGAGVAIPVFSLKSNKSYGIGDFGDLKQMIDWAVHIHQKIVQILPINDTTMTHTWTDSYPYNSISIYALNPIYADLKQMGTLKDKKIVEQFRTKQKELNNLSDIDYEMVSRTKWEYFRLIFKQEGAETIVSKAFISFFKNNKEWLQPYAAFSYLRDVYKTPDFHEWPRHGAYNVEEIEKMCSPDSPDYSHIAIYYFIQFHLHLQLSDATNYARQHGVVLKGDIPIGISRCSVEAWTEPYYFNMNGQAGAPPDDFSANGQNWGFPTYNWDVMEKDGYRWWMKRFQKMAEYFDAYRIDHILGFFRIWEIPMNSVHGLLGHFVPALPMTVEEIENYGLPFREEYLRPYIHEQFLRQIFGPYTDYVKENFITSTEVPDIYHMRTDFDTQRKVEAYFSGQTDEKSNWIREGLYSLISNVLFVPDSREVEKYHPRISAQCDYTYRTLSEDEKSAFSRLYDQYYYHRHNLFWQQQAMNKLPQLTQATRMLVCGEDLGMIPECVAWVMNDLRILSLEIQRMPKEPGYEFGHLNEYPYRSVCTISTHDMSTLRGWWEEDCQQTQRYYNQILGHYGAAPTVATSKLCEEVVRDHLNSNSILCILSLQDWLSIDEKWRNPNVQEERINIPSNPRHYWKYRMHLTLEQLMKADSLNQKIRELIKQTGRNPEQ